MLSDNSARRSGQRAVAWDDRLWLKISVPKNDFVSSGVLFFRGAHDIEEIRCQIGRALREYPKLLGPPVMASDGVVRWEPNPMFDPLENVSVRSVPASVIEVDGHLQLEAPLEQAFQELVGAGLPSDRPLWRIVIVTGLRYGGEDAFCLVFSTHHSVADGVAYYDMLANICEHPERGKHRVREPQLEQSTWISRLYGRARYLLGTLVPEPDSPLIQGPAGGLTLAISAAHPAATLARVAKGAGVSLNALTLAALARALGIYSAERCGRTPRWIRAVLPVSAHTRDEVTHELVNRMGYFHVKMAVREKDVVVLARAIDAQLRSFKIYRIDTMMRGLARFITALPKVLTRATHRFFSSRSSIVVSCFPFPSGALHLGGAEAVNLGAFPVIPVPLSLSAMIVTYASTLTLYLKSSGVHHDVGGVVRGFAEILRQLEAQFGEDLATGRLKVPADRKERACSA
jgi:Wax ester synthase-like Acyl-CoA acyltransferase domain/WS/DGAT C-terminal domain